MIFLLSSTFVTSNPLALNRDESLLRSLPCHLLTIEGLFDFIKLNCQQQFTRETPKTDFNLTEGICLFQFLINLIN